MQAKINSSDKLFRNGRYVVMKAELNGSEIVLGNIYGTNEDDPSVLQEFFDKIESYACSVMILGGDWNAVLNVKMDRVTKAKRVSNNHRCQKMIKQFMDYKDLVDVWRLNNPQKKRFSFYRKNPVSKSRIDFFIISENLYSQKTKPIADIVDGYLTDHSMITLELHIGKAKRGNSYWKLNIDLLLNEEYINLIKHCIQDTIATNETENVSKHVLLQTVLCVVRGESLKFSSQRKSERKKKLEHLQNEINSYGGEPKSKEEKDRLSKLKQERDEEISSQTERNMLLCKANWREYAEKGSKYFHNLVRRKKGPKSFTSLELENTVPGETSAEIEDMLEESTVFFEKLYAPCDLSAESSSENFFVNIKPVPPELIQIGEQPISATELEATLRTMEDGSSPGPDGFTAGFYKVFWNEIKGLILSVVEEIIQT